MCRLLLLLVFVLLVSVCAAVTTATATAGSSGSRRLSLAFAAALLLLLIVFAVSHGGSYSLSSFLLLSLVLGQREVKKNNSGEQVLGFDWRGVEFV